MDGMKIKKFVGQTFKEAMESVKKEFGPDAIILSNRQIKSGPFGILSKSAVEVTAAIDESQASNTSPKNLTASNITDEVAKELRGLKDEIGFLKETLRPIVPSLRISREKRGLFNLLIRQGVDTQLALVLVERSRENIDSLKKVISQDMKIQGISPIEERGIIFVGPPGVGKTTTLSKIAHIIQNKKKPVSIITLDDNRISTIAHFKEMSRLLKCPVRSIKKISDLPKIIYKEIGRTSILIDTPGYESKDILGGLGEIFPSGFPLKKCFVMDTSINETTSIKLWEDCNKYGIDAIGFTKLDLATQFGNLYNLSIITGRPVSFMTTGPDIPFDIKMPTSEFMAGLVVGGV